MWPESQKRSVFGSSDMSSSYRQNDFIINEEEYSDEDFEEVVDKII